MKPSPAGLTPRHCPGQQQWRYINKCRCTINLHLALAAVTNITTGRRLSVSSMCATASNANWLCVLDSATLASVSLAGWLIACMPAVSECVTPGFKTGTGARATGLLTYLVWCRNSSHLVTNANTIQQVANATGQQALGVYSRGR